MYEPLRNNNDYIHAWLSRKSGIYSTTDYRKLVDQIRSVHTPIKIRFGLEICYFQDFEELIDRETRHMGLDFLVGSIHFIDYFPYDHKPEFWEGQNVDLLYQRYFEDSIALANSGLFQGIAHPDCIKLFGHQPTYPLLESYEQLAQALEKNRMYAEQNSGAYRRGNCELGMNPELLKTIKSRGVPIMTASDAHKPEDVGALIPELEKLIVSA